MVRSSPSLLLAPRVYMARTQSKGGLTGTSQSSTPARDQKVEKFGDDLFWKVVSLEPRLHAWTTADLCGKITGMILDLNEKEIVHLSRDNCALQCKIREAIRLLEEYQFDLKMTIYQAVRATNSTHTCSGAAVVEWILSTVALDELGPLVKSPQCLRYLVSRALTSRDIEEPVVVLTE